MRVLVATGAIDEKGEFSFAIPGVLVHFPPVMCDCPDCGCERSMVGFTSQKATTCFVARDLSIEPGTCTDLLYETLARSGWVSDEQASDRAWVAEWAREHQDVAAGLPVETPLRLRGGRVLIKRRAA
jgi:hypothetical protein